MNTKVVWSEGLAFTGFSEAGYTVPLGTVSSQKGGFRPLELMLISLAGCTGMDVISILEKKRQKVTGFEVRVNAGQQSEHPHVFTKAEITYLVSGQSVEEAAVLRAIELSALKYCPAQSMLAKAFPMELVYEIYEIDEIGRETLASKGKWQPPTE